MTETNRSSKNVVAYLDDLFSGDTQSVEIRKSEWLAVKEELIARRHGLTAEQVASAKENLLQQVESRIRAAVETQPGASKTITDRELYLLTECMTWQSCSHLGCKARREIERLRPMAESWESYEAAQERKAEMRPALETSDNDAVRLLRELPYCTCNDEPYAVQGGHRTSCPSQWVDDVMAELHRLQKLVQPLEPKAQCAYIGAPQGTPQGCTLSAGHSGPHSHGVKASGEYCGNWPCRLPRYHVGPCNSSPENGDG